MRNKSFLNLEGLTERVTPAVSGISFMGGNLSVRLDSQGGTLSLLGDGNNYKIEFQSLTAATSKAIGNNAGYNVTGSISVLSANGNDIINIEPQAAGDVFVVPGNLNINTGNGSDTINILGGADAGTATIAGNVSINAGNGADNLNLSTGAAANTLTINGRVNFIGGNGLDTVTSDNGNLEINGLTTLNQVNVLTLNPDATATNTINLVSLQISNPMAESPANNINLIGDATANAVTINGSFNYTGNMRDDNIAIDGATILGNTLLNLYAADTDNTVTLAANADTLLQGNLTIIAGNGADTIVFDSTNDTEINGSVSMNLGSGTNNVTLDTATVAGGIAGSMTIYGGNGNDVINIGVTAVFAINGSLTVSVGNTVGAGTDKNEFQLNDTTVGGGVTYSGGSGIDSVELTGVTTVANSLNVYLGAGADQLSLTDTTVDLGALFADFGVDLADDVFTNNSAQDFDIQIRNFP
jgi:hypothetical protein